MLTHIYRHRAASLGYSKIMELLIEYQCRINPKDSEGNTPLHNACEEGHGDCAILLIQHGADIDRLNTEGKTPIELCSDPQVKAFISRYVETTM